MTKETWIALVSSLIGLMIGVGTAYTVLKVDDAVLKTRVTQLECNSIQYQKDINVFRVELSKVNTEVKNTDRSYLTLRDAIKEMSISNNNLTVAITRLDERQKSFEEFMKQYLGDNNEYSFRDGPTGSQG